MREVDGHRGRVEGRRMPLRQPVSMSSMTDNERRKRQPRGRSGCLGGMAAESRGQLSRCYVLSMLATRGRRVRPNVEDALAATGEDPVDNE